MHALVTGFPGFIARRLVAKLVEGDPELRVTALVEARMAGPIQTVGRLVPVGPIEIPGIAAASPRERDRVGAARRRTDGDRRPRAGVDVRIGR